MRNRCRRWTSKATRMLEEVTRGCGLRLQTGAKTSGTGATGAPKRLHQSPTYGRNLPRSGLHSSSHQLSEWKLPPGAEPVSETNETWLRFEESDDSTLLKAVLRCLEGTQSTIRRRRGSRCARSEQIRHLRLGSLLGDTCGPKDNSGCF